MTRRVGELLLVALGFVVMTMVVFRPLPWHLSTLVYNPENNDGQFSVWNVAWVARALFRDPLHVLDANIFYPHRWTLAYSELNLMAGALASPVYWFTGSAYAAHNFVLLLSFVLSGTSMYFLCREVSGNRLASVPAAIAFAYCPHLFAHLPHIQLLMTAGLPLSLLALHRVVDQPSVGRGAALGVAMAAQAYACAYYSIFVLLMVGFGVLVLAGLRRNWISRAYWTAIAIAAAVSITLSLPLVVTAVFLQQSGFERTLAGSRQYVADWRAYLASGNLLHAWMLSHLGHWKEVLFPGVLALVLGVLGLVVGLLTGGRRREIAVLYGGLTVTAVWASFGPDAGLYAALYRIIPTFSLLRAPSRFGIVVVFSLCALASMGLAWLLERTRRGPMLAAVCIAVACAEAQVPIAFGHTLDPHPAYRLLATLPDGPVLELPVYSRALGFRRARYMLDSTTHWKPLVDAYSDHIPPDFDARAEALADFPSIGALTDMKRDRVRYAVIHLEPYEPAMRAELDQRARDLAPYLRELHRDGELVMYEVTGYP